MNFVCRPCRDATALLLATDEQLLALPRIQKRNVAAGHQFCQVRNGRRCDCQHRVVAP